MNAKEELLEFIEDNKLVIKCANIIKQDIGEDDIIINLKCNYTIEEYNNFLELLNFEYNPSFGYNYIIGNIWCLDNTWIDREEYDGSEWWNHKKSPEIPKDLLNK